MGCSPSVIVAGLTPPNAVDIKADKAGDIADDTHTLFDVGARASFMDPRLKPFISDNEYEEVM